MWTADEVGAASPAVSFRRVIGFTAVRGTGKGNTATKQRVFCGQGQESLSTSPAMNGSSPERHSSVTALTSLTSVACYTISSKDPTTLVPHVGPTQKFVGPMGGDVFIRNLTYFTSR
jgi:hypothetical protein